MSPFHPRTGPRSRSRTPWRGLTTALLLGSAVIGTILAPSQPAAAQVDSDMDGLRDDVEIAIGTDPYVMDTDRNGYSDEREYTYGTDPLVADALDGSGNTAPGVDDPNGVRIDSDGDGLYDWDEPNVYFTDPGSWDTDGDEVADGAEVYNGTDPNDSTDF